MAINLLNLLKDQVSDVLIDNAGSLLNENTTGIRKALDGILPTLLGSAAQKASSQEGAEKLMKTLGDGQFDGGLLDNLGSLFGGGSSGNLDDLMSQGSDLLNMFLGSDQKQSGVMDMIANFAGINKNSAGSLLKMAAPLMMSLLGRQVKSKGLNLGGLMNLLSEQTDYIKAAMPAGLAGIGKLLDFRGPLANLGAAVDQTAREAQATVEGAAAGSRNWLPWVAGLAVVALIAFFLLNRRGDVERATEAVAGEVEKAAEAVEEGLEHVRDDVVAAVPAIGRQINDFLTSGKDWREADFSLAHADFAEGSARLGNKLTEELRGLAELMKANPGMKVKLTAYATDGLEVAEQRALAIKSQLQEFGIASARITTGSHQSGARKGNSITVNITDM